MDVGSHGGTWGTWGHELQLREREKDAQCNISPKATVTSVHPRLKVMGYDSIVLKLSSNLLVCLPVSEPRLVIVNEGVKAVVR